MNCLYCITSSNFFDNCDIDIDFAKRGIKDYFDKIKYPYLRFVALGEPTQNFGALRELHDYAKKLTANRVKFEIQTNGFFNKGVAYWIANNIHEVWLSFDGLPDVHDKIKRSKNDKPTSGTILRNLNILQKKTFVGFRTTITRINVHRQLEAIRFAHKHKVKAIFTKIMLPPANIASKHKFYQIKDYLGVDIMDYTVNFIKAWKLSRKLGIFFGNGYINNFDEMCEYACRACVPCPHLTPDGYVSACDRATYGKTSLQEFIYGKYDPVKKIIKYDKNKIKALRSRTIHNMPECQSCTIKFRCAGGCLGTCAQLTGSMFKVIPEYCKAIRYMFENIERDPREGLFPYFMT